MGGGKNRENPMQIVVRNEFIHEKVVIYFCFNTHYASLSLCPLTENPGSPAFPRLLIIFLFI